MLCNERGHEIPVDDSKFASMFIEYKRTKHLALIMLNSCESGVERGFNGLARQLMETKNIPCVIGMQFKIHDEAGPYISTQFYEEFIKDYDAEEAIVSTQERLYYYYKFGNTAEFISPVIYTCNGEGRILRNKLNPLEKLCKDFIDNHTDLDWSTVPRIKQNVPASKRFQ